MMNQGNVLNFWYRPNASAYVFNRSIATEQQVLFIVTVIDNDGPK